MQFWSDKNTRNILLGLFAIISVAFLVNLVLKLDLYGQRTTDAGESWLSAVSAIYIGNWLTEGITNLKFAMVRTYDSVEMRSLYDREVYASFLPGCLILPYFVAKIFSIKASLIYLESFASLFHYLGALISTFISFLLCKRLKLSAKKTFFFSIFTGLSYIYAYINFHVLSFGYYTDTSVYLFYLLFLLTEFTQNTSLRLLQKACLIFAGFCHEWFFVSITLVSIFVEIKKIDGKKRIPAILFSHLAPALIALGLYGYHLHVLDKLEHSIDRMLRRSFFNPISHTKFDSSFSDLWKQLLKKNKVVIIFTGLITFWNNFESKLFKENECFKSIFILSFGASVLQIIIALQHSAEHSFAGIKLLIPLSIFIPFLAYEISELFKEKYRTIFLTIFLSTILLVNFSLDAYTLKNFRAEHRIYKQLDQVFKDYDYHDLFFSYNLEILMDKYPKEDIKTTERDVPPSDRIEGEPFLHYTTKKQVYYITKPEDILYMLENRTLHDKAKVHLIFYKNICSLMKNKLPLKQITKEIYVLDIPKEDFNNPDFIEKYKCGDPAKVYGYFGTITDYNRN